MHNPPLFASVWEQHHNVQIDVHHDHEQQQSLCCSRRLNSMHWHTPLLYASMMGKQWASSSALSSERQVVMYSEDQSNPRAPNRYASLPCKTKRRRQILMRPGNHSPNQRQVGWWIQCCREQCCGGCSGQRVSIRIGTISALIVRVAVRIGGINAERDERACWCRFRHIEQRIEPELGGPLMMCLLESKGFGWLKLKARRRDSRMLCQDLRENTGHYNRCIHDPLVYEWVATAMCTASGIP